MSDIHAYIFLSRSRFHIHTPKYITFSFISMHFIKLLIDDTTASSLLSIERGSAFRFVCCFSLISLLVVRSVSSSVSDKNIFLPNIEILPSLPFKKLLCLRCIPYIHKVKKNLILCGSLFIFSYTICIPLVFSNMCTYCCQC